MKAAQAGHAKAGDAAHIPDADLRRLDEEVVRALDSGDDSGLAVLGYGEISLVLGWPREDPALACKRLPPFPDRDRFHSFAEALADYLEALEAAGAGPLPSELRALDGEGGGVAAYVLQPVLPAETLGPAVLARADPAEGHPLVGAIVATARAAVGPRVGLDAQLANWAWEEGRLRYIDVTTPMLWSEDGRSLLDLDLLAKAYPAILRVPLKRLVAPGILDGYRNLRGVFFDLAGNLIKERLEDWIPPFLAEMNGVLDEPITLEQVRSYYRRDARLWELLLRIRRADRFWRRRIRRRPYPFLLPKTIER